MDTTAEKAPTQRALFAVPPDPGDAVVVNDRVTVRTSGEQRVVVVDGLVLHHYSVEDRVAEAYAMVSLVDCGYAGQNDVARSFGRSARSLRRYQERYDGDGLRALGRAPGRPAGARPKGAIGGKRDRAVLGMKAEGNSNREIAKQLGISETAVRKRLKRVGWVALDAQDRMFDAELVPPAPTQEATPTGCPSPTKPQPLALAPEIVDPLDRGADRALAHAGVLDDAVPIFAAAASVPRAGVLLAIPGVVRSGLVEIGQAVYGERALAPAFYGLRTTLVALVLLALLRIKRPEELKEHAPPELGRLLGLDRRHFTDAFPFVHHFQGARDERSGHGVARSIAST
jgi:transposase